MMVFEKVTYFVYSRCDIIDLNMKNKNAMLDEDKYRELIQKMESRRNRLNENASSNPNLAYGSQNARNPYGNGGDYRGGDTEGTYKRYQPNDDQRIKSTQMKPDFGKMPQSAKNARNEQPRTPVGQEYFRRKQENQKMQLRTEENKDSPKQKKFTKQFQQVLFNAQKNINSTDKIESSSEYEKLHQKLDHIENKISEMKSNLQRKKEEKRKMMENQKRTLLQLESKNDNKTNALSGYLTQVPEHKELHSFEKNPYSPKHNIYYVSEIVRAYKQEKSLAREHLFTSLQVFRMLQNSPKPTDEEMLARRVNLPKRKGYEDKKTVVFDLDQTLIHCNQNLSVDYDVKLPIKFPTGEVIEAGINIRPHCREILQNISKRFQIIVFTASHSCYASVVLDHLDPNGEYIHHRLYREHCHATPEGIYIKDLRIINRELADMVLVDNAAYSYAFQVDNGIPILPYYHGDTDFELKALQHYIEAMVMVKDVRAINKRTFKLHQYPEYYEDPEKLVEDLYLSQH